MIYPMARAPNVRAASRTQKIDQKHDLWSDSHGTRKCARAKKFRIGILQVKLMLFDYLIIVISLKLAEPANVEVWRKSKNQDFRIWTLEFEF